MVAVFAWSPWLTKVEVEKGITEKFNSEWYGVSDGCGPLKVDDIKDTRRIPFGFLSLIRYECGMLPADVFSESSWHSVYVSPLGTIHGDFLQN